MDKNIYVSKNRSINERRKTVEWVSIEAALFWNLIDTISLVEWVRNLLINKYFHVRGGIKGKLLKTFYQKHNVSVHIFWRY